MEENILNKYYIIYINMSEKLTNEIDEIDILKICKDEGVINEKLCREYYKFLDELKNKKNKNDSIKYINKKINEHDNDSDHVIIQKGLFKLIDILNKQEYNQFKNKLSKYINNKEVPNRIPQPPPAPGSLLEQITNTKLKFTK